MDDTFSFDNENHSEILNLPTDFLMRAGAELRYPLNDILGFSRHILGENDGPLTDFQKSDLGSIYISGHKLLNQINNILDIAKIEAGKLNFLIHQVNVGKLLDHFSNAFSETEFSESKQIVSQYREEQIINLARTLRDKKVALKMSIAADLPIIWADSLRLFQIFYKLISNAVQYTTEGSIEITAYQDNDSFIFGVHDTGPGLSDRIITELANVKSRHTLYAAPSCMGLAISRSLVELHGGTMEIESRENLGTNITFDIPISENKPVYEIVQEGESFIIYNCNTYNNKRQRYASSITMQGAEERKQELESTIYP